jgi:hypothetical protein
VYDLWLKENSSFLSLVSPTLQMHLQMLIDKSLTKPNCYCYLAVVEMARPKRIAEVQEVVSILAVPEEEVSNLAMLAY